MNNVAGLEHDDCDTRKRVDALVAEEARHAEAELQAMTLEERGRRIQQACRLAALQEQSRRRAGLPPTVPVPWPESTREFLRKYAPDGQRESSASPRP
jgi:hypothetical protein